jgi:hypothetical protein
VIPTLTAADATIFPEDVLRFAADRGVTEYLVPLYELARRCFDGVDVAVKVEHDYEAPGLSWVVFEVPVAAWDMGRYQAAHDRWLAGFGGLCPSDLSIHFVLGMR